MTRLLRHLFASPWGARRAFPPRTLQAIEAAIAHSELRHRGELRFVIERALDPLSVLRGQSPRERAIEVFSLLRVWDTAHNTGVLIHVLLADRSVEIVADRGIHAAVGEAGWRPIAQAMEQAFAQGRFEQGALDGIAAVSRCLDAHVPADGAPPHNELPDAAVLL
jgi:uncharacterized membrane protein